VLSSRARYSNEQKTNNEMGNLTRSGLTFEQWLAKKQRAIQEKKRLEAQLATNLINEKYLFLLNK
jgi:hypothetical protein